MLTPLVGALLAHVEWPDLSSTARASRKLLYGLPRIGAPKLCAEGIAKPPQDVVFDGISHAREIPEGFGVIV